MRELEILNFCSGASHVIAGMCKQLTELQADMVHALSQEVVICSGGAASGGAWNVPQDMMLVWLYHSPIKKQAHASYDM
jgi:hypothetical protein